MKGKLATIIMGALCALLFCGMGVGICRWLCGENPYRHHEKYAKTMRVCELDKETDTVTMVDSNGNLWEMGGCEDWFVGDGCACIMDNNGTETIYDDVVVKATYERR